MQRDEFDDEALLTCKPLVLHTHATENNVTSSALAHFEREDFKLRDHPTDRGHRLEVVADVAGSVCGRIKGRENDSRLPASSTTSAWARSSRRWARKSTTPQRQRRRGEVPLDWFTQDVHP